MSDLSLFRCKKCNRPEYDCTCNEGMCTYCGSKLTADEIKCGREECFDCYCNHQG
jgi:hypothetical protein